jgi:hypothetical protein
MRMIVLKQASDLQALTKRLLKPGAAGSAASLDKLKALNPHVDFARIDAGTILLVPDHPDFEGGEASSIGGAAFDSLSQDAITGMKAASARMRATFERHEAERKEIGAVFKSAGFKRLIENDEALKKQAAEVESRFKAEAKRATDVAALLEATEKAMQSELAGLGKLFR